MSTTFSLTDTIIIIGIVQAVASSLYVIFAPFNKRSNWLLAICLIYLGVSVFKLLIHTLGLWDTVWFHYHPLSIELYGPPLLYLFAKSLQHPKEKALPHFWWHLLPGTLFMAHSLMIYFLCLAEPDFSQKAIIGLQWGYNLSNSIEEQLMIPSYLVYMYFGFIELKRYRKLLLDYAADRLVQYIFWVQLILVLAVVLVIIGILFVIANEFFQYHYTNYWHLEFFMIYQAIFVYLLGIFAYRHAHLPPLEAFKPKETTPIQKTPEATERFNALFNQTKTAMETKQYYLDPELSLPAFAKLVKLKTHEVSQAINEQTGNSFRDFINGYRIEAVKEKLKDPKFEHLSILGIALECGFNSEASFYRVFKKTTGLSPKRFREAPQ